ncbi:MAG: asparagine--tRNA ligase [Candidatus Thermoplasmatota archaeon]|nr:asparagine--tRNA ligase [Candidatus Thermoplasmatota archaeon]
MFTPIKDILAGKYENQEVNVRGWIYRTRSSGKLAFVTLRDASGIIQTTVAKNDVEEKDFENAKKALIESSVKISGVVAKDERAPGGYEIRAKKFELIGKSDVFPITEYQSEEFLLDKRHLWIRSRELMNVMKIKASLLKYCREWFNENSFYEVTPPTITPSACEGGTTLFEFNYFDKKAYLSQSAQLYLEALIYSLERVWSLTPSFRAEKSKTRRHLAEYWHLEAEEAWVGNEENMRIQEELISYICQSLAENNRDELEFFKRKTETLKNIEPPFERIKYENAVEILKNKDFDFNYGMDFGTKEESALCSDIEKPVFITNFPKTIKPFYMKEADEKTYLCADLLAPEGYGEIIGGSERETDYNKLVERMKEQNMNTKDYEWYLDLRKYGSVQHSGFGLGVERIVRWVCKLEHIRDATPFPRTINRVYP